jgi:hypothetical protein
MSFPIYNCGKILFKDGDPAMSKNCCCKYYVCCADCFFPVSPEISEDPFVDIGGPTQIKNWKREVTRDTPYTCEDGAVVEDNPVFMQDGPSKHLVNAIGFSCFPDDDLDDASIFVKYSRCTFEIPVLLQNQPYPNCPEIDIGGSFPATIQYLGNGRWLMGNGRIGLGGCDGTVVSGNVYVDSTGALTTDIVTFTVERVFPPGKSAADYECPNPNPFVGDAAGL